MGSVVCAFCGEPVPLDVEHVEIEGATLPRTEWANVDEYVAHVDCWAEETDGWADPA